MAKKLEELDEAGLNKLIKKNAGTIAFLIDEYGDEASLDKHASQVVTELRAMNADAEARLAALSKSTKPPAKPQR